MQSDWHVAVPLFRLVPPLRIPSGPSESLFSAGFPGFVVRSPCMVLQSAGFIGEELSVRKVWDAARHPILEGLPTRLLEVRACACTACPFTVPALAIGAHHPCRKHKGGCLSRARGEAPQPGQLGLGTAQSWTCDGPEWVSAANGASSISVLMGNPCMLEGEALFLSAAPYASLWEALTKEYALPR